MTKITPSRRRDQRKSQPPLGPGRVWLLVAALLLAALPTTDVGHWLSVTRADAMSSWPSSWTSAQVDSGVRSSDNDSQQIEAGGRQPPRPIEFPADEAPHANRTEWWYYTGHVRATNGDLFGFELTFFQALLEKDQRAYVGHFAVTDTARNVFRYAQRVAVKPQPAPTTGFSLAVDTWSMRGALGHDALKADLPGYRLELEMVTDRPPMLHGGGYLNFGVAGDTYYYTRSRLTATGVITVGDLALPVTGLAWMDHQWGDFAINPREGGWDWFCAQLDDGSDLMVVNLRDANHAIVGAFGTWLDADGATIDLQREDFTVTATGAWLSPRSGIEWPSGWRLQSPKLDLDLTVTPMLVNQELDTRLTTQMVYWEGLTYIKGTRRGGSIAGHGYTELTGY